MKEKVEQEVVKSVEGMGEEQRNRIMAMAATADFALQVMIEKWDELVPQAAVPLLKRLQVTPLGPKGKVFTLGQRMDAQRALKEVPFLFAAYIDTLRKVLETAQDKQQ